jgi:hypothetical protein
MSRIIIVDHEQDLSSWLEEHKLTIEVRKTNYGFVATFTGQLFVDGAAPCPIGDCPLDAVRKLVNSLRGARIGIAGPPHIIVPEFTGINDAVQRAQHTSVKP